MLNKKEEYEARIASATPLGLVIITYEMLIDYIEAAINASDTDEFMDNIEGAIDSNGLLMDSLDLSYEIGKDLMAIYIYINKLLVNARLNRETVLMQEAMGLADSLLESWREIAKTDDGLPVLGNSKVFEGLTYKNGKLSEMVVDSDKNDFKVLCIFRL